MQCCIYNNISKLIFQEFQKDPSKDALQKLISDLNIIREIIKISKKKINSIELIRKYEIQGSRLDRIYQIILLNIRSIEKFELLYNQVIKKLSHNNVYKEFKVEFYPKLEDIQKHKIKNILSKYTRFLNIKYVENKNLINGIKINEMDQTLDISVKKKISNLKEILLDK